MAIRHCQKERPVNQMIAFREKFMMEEKMEGNFMPRVTIGIPTFNRAATFLKESLGSAMRQNYPNLEILVSDNQSTDGTESYLQSIDDRRVRYIRQEKAVAPHDNAHRVLKEATGDYFLLLHDDDMIDPDFVTTAVAAMEGREVGLVHTGVRKIDQTGKVIEIRENPHGSSSDFEYFVAVLEGRAVTFFCNTLYHTDHLRAIGGFKSKSHAYQDVMANLQIVKMYERIEISEPKASYRMHGSKLGWKFSIDNWCDDSLQMIDLMSRLMPERKAFFQTQGKRIMCEKNYAKKVRRLNLLRQPYAYWTIYRRFGFEYSPLEFFASRFCRLFRSPRLRRV